MFDSFYFVSWHSSKEDELSWVNKAKSAEADGAAAVIFITETKQSAGKKR
jgi:hypothetical protein